MTPPLFETLQVAHLDGLSEPCVVSDKVSLLGTDRAALREAMAHAGLPAFRGDQVFEGVFAKGARSFAELTTLPRSLREDLAARFSLDLPTPVVIRQDSGGESAEFTSAERGRIAPSNDDGTCKFAFAAPDGGRYESVFIPEVARARRTNTLCISSQTGCALGCRFCFTASIRKNRNLSAAEIVGQVLAAWDRQVTNIVFMGMGEPLLNFREVVRAIRVLTDPRGLAFSTRRVTVSTAGIVPRIAQLGAETLVQLAVSLNATTDAVRDEIMPINKRWPISELMAALRGYPLQKRRRITIEYVLLSGVNDTDADARRLVRLVSGIPVKINLLPLNPHERTVYQPPPAQRVASFQSIVSRAGLTVNVRRARGQQIAAACGQLGEGGQT